MDSEVGLWLTIWPVAAASSNDEVLEALADLFATCESCGNALGRQPQGYYANLCSSDKTLMQQYHDSVCSMCRATSTPDLIDEILQHLSQAQILEVQQVSVTFHRSINSCKELKVQAFLAVNAMKLMPLPTSVGNIAIRLNALPFSRRLPRSGNYLVPFVAIPGIKEARFGGHVTRCSMQRVLVRFDPESGPGALTLLYNGSWTKQYLSDPALPIRLEVERKTKMREMLADGSEKVVSYYAEADVILQPCQVGTVMRVAQAMGRALCVSDYVGHHPIQLMSPTLSALGMQNDPFTSKKRSSILYSTPQHRISVVQSVRRMH